MTVKEFRESRLLMEVNRRVLHPLGLALSVKARKDGKPFYRVDLTGEEMGLVLEALTPPTPDPARAALLRRLEELQPVEMAFDDILDHRDDPEGIYFGEFTAEDIAAANAIRDQLKERMPARFARLGWWVEPLV